MVFIDSMFPSQYMMQNSEEGCLEYLQDFFVKTNITSMLTINLLYNFISGLTG